MIEKYTPVGLLVFHRVCPHHSGQKDCQFVTFTHGGLLLSDEHKWNLQMRHLGRPHWHSQNSSQQIYQRIL